MTGWKTITGTVGWALCEGAKPVFPDAEPVFTAFQNIIFIPLGVIGIGHKIDKVKE